MCVNQILQKYRELILYVVFGVFTTVCNFVVYVIATRLFNLSIEIANILGWFLSVLFAYITHRQYVFLSDEHGKNIIKELFSFYGSRLFTGLLDFGGMWLLADYLKFNDMITKVMLNIVIIILNFVLSKFLVFQKKN